MRNLLLLFSKYGSLILFILLEAISLFLIINYNNKQKEIFLYSSNVISGSIQKNYEEATDYFSLQTQNDSILSENARYLSLLHNQNPDHFPILSSDSLSLDYKFIPAHISAKTIHVRNNRMTLDKGLDAGVEIGMGVLSENGIVGVVKKVNKYFSSVIPVINTRLFVSAKIKHKNYIGDLSWQPYDERILILNNIPKHANVVKGDTVITSGYSTIFPENIDIGRIESILLPAGSNYFEIIVKMNNDLSNLEHVYIIDYKLSKQKKEMETED